jgi:hypothetical protein
MHTRIPTLSILAALCTTQCPAAEDNSAQTLYEENCVSCHGPEVYTREERKISSLSALEKQVRHCETALGLLWFDEDISAVAQLLNERFYHFKP